MSEPKFNVQSVTFAKGQSGNLDQAQVLITVLDLEPNISLPWIQVSVFDVIKPEDAVLKAREPLVKFLKQAEEAALKLAK